MKTKTKTFTVESWEYDSEEVLHESNDLSMEPTPYCELVINEYDNEGEFSETVINIIQN